jgi:hypothetical protein
MASLFGPYYEISERTILIAMQKLINDKMATACMFAYNPYTLVSNLNWQYKGRGNISLEIMTILRALLYC